MPGQTRTPGDQCGTLLYSMSFVFSGQKAVGSSFAKSYSLTTVAAVDPSTVSTADQP